MDMATASAAPITAKIGGRQRVFRLLSRRDFGDLINRMAGDDRAARHRLSIFDVHRWAGTPDGAVTILAVASGETPEITAQWGSMVQRSTVASLITAESMTIGDEDGDSGDGSGVEDEKRPDPTSTVETTSTRLALSPGNARGSAIRGCLRRLFGTRRSRGWPSGRRCVAATKINCTRRTSGA